MHLYSVNAPQAGRQAGTPTTKNEFTNNLGENTRNMRIMEWYVSWETSKRKYKRR